MIAGCKGAQECLEHCFIDSVIHLLLIIIIIWVAYAADTL